MTDQTEVEVQDAPEAAEPATTDEVTDSEATAQDERIDPDEVAAEVRSGDFDPDVVAAKIRRANDQAAKSRMRTKDIESAAEKVPTLEAENLRLRVAIKHGLPESVAKRLTGNTEEELLQDAQELLELFTVKKPPSDQPREQLRGGGDPTVPVAETDRDAIVERMFRN